MIRSRRFSCNRLATWKLALAALLLASNVSARFLKESTGGTPRIVCFKGKCEQVHLCAPTASDPGHDHSVDHSPFCVYDEANLYYTSSSDPFTPSSQTSNAIAFNSGSTSSASTCSGSGCGGTHSSTTVSTSDRGTGSARFNNLEKAGKRVATSESCSNGVCVTTTETCIDGKCTTESTTPGDDGAAAPAPQRSTGMGMDMGMGETMPPMSGGTITSTATATSSSSPGQGTSTEVTASGNGSGVAVASNGTSTETASCIGSTCTTATFPGSAPEAGSTDAGDTGSQAAGTRDTAATSPSAPAFPSAAGDVLLSAHGTITALACIVGATVASFVI